MWRAGLLAACLLLLGLAGRCADAPLAVPPATAPSDDVVYVLDHGWHTDLGVPSESLHGPIAVFRDIFPGARSFVFSFGKRTFLTAPVDDWTEYVLGPVPGPAAVLVTGLAVLPDAAYDDDPAVLLRLPAGGAEALSAFIWRSFLTDEKGRPRLLDRAPFPGGLFYASGRTYTLFYTCNTWTVDALRAAGLTVSPDGVVFASQAMRRAAEAAALR